MIASGPRITNVRKIISWSLKITQMNILKRREPSKPFHRKIHKHHITTCPSRYQHPSNTQNLRRHQEDNVVMLIDTTSTQNFIDRKLVEPLN
jgi:hypothetical protein